MTRWQLSRAGILNVYQYENETLEFRGGRLLLRGINGSGKSTAMNMLLPFLLTGRTRGIDAAGEQTGVLKSWMLSGREEAQPVGYLWVEFARGGETTPAEHLIIGCGIKANRASETVTTWWFVTRRRPGIDLQLVEHGVPLSADGLRAALDPDPIFAQDRRADYRREISRRLYGGADNEPWLALLDTVRNPRVGDRIDVDLPAYLTRSLPTLSETALIEAARPLDDLDEHRRNVADLDKTDATLRAIGDVYRQYALAELHRESAEARTVLKRADDRSSDERRALQANEAAALAAEDAAGRLTSLNASVRTLDEEIRALQASSAYTEGRQLDDLRTAVAELERRLAKQRRGLDAMLEDWRRDTDQVVQRQGRVEGDQRKLQAELADIAGSIASLSLAVRLPSPSPVARRTLASEDARVEVPADDFDGADIEAALALTAAAALARRGDIDALMVLNEALLGLAASLRDARAKHEAGEQSVVEAEASLGESRAASLQAREAWDVAVAAWIQDVSSHLGQCVHPLPAELQERWRPLVEAEVRIDRAARRASLDAFGESWQDERRRTLLRHETGERAAREAETDARSVLDELLARRQPVLPRPDWQRGDAVPFADAVEFREEVDDGTRAALEAALQASGLLSAAIGRDGLRLDAGELIAVGADAVESPLAAFLEPIAPDDAPAGLDLDAVSRLLASISTDLAGDARTVITVAGEFQLGSLSGRHGKPLAEHVGTGARRAALERQRALARTALEQAEAHRIDMEAARGVAGTALQACTEFRRSLPSLVALEQSDATVRAAEAHRLRRQERARETGEVAAQLDRRHAAATDERDRQARTLRLPGEAGPLREVGASLDSLKRDARDASRSLQEVARSVGEWRRAAERWQGTADRLEDARAQLEQDIAHHDGQRTRLDTLEATLGSAFREVVATLGEREGALAEVRTSLPAAESERERSITVRAAAQAALEQAVAARREAELACERRHAHLVDVTAVPGLIDIVQVDESGESLASRLGSVLASNTADRAGLARLLTWLRRALPALPDGDPIIADGVRNSMRQRRDALGAGWDAENHQPETTLPLALTVNGPRGRFTLADALVDVGGNLQLMQSLLSRKQDQALRTLLHGQLAGDVARKLQQAKTLVARMNERLGSVTTSHGIGVRLRWRRGQELDESTGRMVDILEKLPDLRSDAEETELRAALSARLDEARRLAPDAPYRELIDSVLDYRRWHDMKVLLRRGDDREVPLSRRTPLSEGEKKLVTYLPLFSAVAAACDALEEAASGRGTGAGAHVGIPRFLLLDDAFAKVSEDNHARLFGLLVELDLDFIATSERLWGTHATVPSLAITEVVRDDIAGVILLEHSRWDGATLTMAAGASA